MNDIKTSERARLGQRNLAALMFWHYHGHKLKAWLGSAASTASGGDPQGVPRTLAADRPARETQQLTHLECLLTNSLTYLTYLLTLPYLLTYLTYLLTIELRVQSLFELTTANRLS